MASPLYRRPPRQISSRPYSIQITDNFEDYYKVIDSFFDYLK